MLLLKIIFEIFRFMTLKKAIILMFPHVKKLLHK